MSQHESLKDAHVHETTVCVTSGALRVGTNFRVLRRCSEYVMIYITSGTHVHQTTLYVTYGARRRSVPLGLLERLLAIWAAKAAQDSGTVPAGGRLGCQRRPGMPCGPSFGMPAATSGPPVGYLA